MKESVGISLDSRQVFLDAVLSIAECVSGVDFVTFFLILKDRLPSYACDFLPFDNLPS